MKKKLLKRLTGIAVAVAMTVTMVTGFSVDVKATAISGHNCELYGKSETEMKQIIKNATGASSIYIMSSQSSGECNFREVSHNDAHCEWECFVHSVNYIQGDDEEHPLEYKPAHIFIEHNASLLSCPYCGWNNPNPPAPPTPTPTPEPQKEDTKEDKKEPAKPADKDTYKSEEPYGTAGVTNTNSKIGDLKVHKVNATTETNQKFLADAFAKQSGKRARILTTVSVHPRRALGVDNGKKEALIYANLEKNPQTVYAVCYNQTDKAYYLTGTLDKDGVATFPDFILRDATNITIFVLE